MGENGARRGRTLGYSRRGWLTALTGGGAVLAALIMMLSPVAAATGAGLTLHAKYKGVVSPSNSLSQSGCGKAAMQVHWHFALKTGLGGSASTGKASSCKKQIAGVGQTASASTYGGFTLAVGLPKLGANVNNISANAGIKFTATTTASDGGKSAVCNNAPSYNTYNFTEWEWNSFSNYAYQDNYSYNGIYYNYSYNVASVPSPFNLNNTTFYYHDSGWSIVAYCQAYTNAYMSVYAYLADLTTGTQMAASGNTLASTSYGSFFDIFTEVYNQTDYGCSQYYEWDQGTSYGSNTTTCFSYNTTLTSVIYTYVPTFSSTTGSNNSVVWTGSMSTTGSIWFNGPFTHGDHYAILLYVSASFYVYNGWQHGFASWGFNMATGGNGFHLTSITIT